MIKIGKVIYDVLSKSTPVTGYTGNKIYQLVVPEDVSTYPVIVYERTSVTPNYVKDEMVISDVIVNIYVISDDYVESVDCGDAVITAFNGYKGTNNGINVMSTRIEEMDETFVDGAYIQKITIKFKIDN